MLCFLTRCDVDTECRGNHVPHLSNTDRWTMRVDRRCRKTVEPLLNALVRWQCLEKRANFVLQRCQLRLKRLVRVELKCARLVVRLLIVGHPMKMFTLASLPIRQIQFDDRGQTLYSTRALPCYFMRRCFASWRSIANARGVDREAALGIGRMGLAHEDLMIVNGFSASVVNIVEGDAQLIPVLARESIRCLPNGVLQLLIQAHVLRMFTFDQREFACEENIEVFHTWMHDWS